MKKIICVFLLVALILCLCACAAEPEWKPYTGTMEGYVYYNETERERAWEEDVLSLANTFLTEHPLLLNEKSSLYYYSMQGFRVKQKNQYNEALYTAFLKSVNDLIPRLSDLTDDQIPYELQKIVAALGDFHSQVILNSEYCFPMLAEPFFVDGGVELRMVVLPRAHKELIYAKLVSVNGIAIDEVIKRLAPYGSIENEYALISRLTDDSLGEMLFHPGILTAAGIMESETDTAHFALETEDGKTHTISIAPVPSEQYKNIDRENRSIYRTYPHILKDWLTDFYWYDLWSEENTAYVRINRFYSEEDETLKQMCESLMSELRENERIDKIVVDMRRNYGGYGMYEDFQRLTQALRLPQIKNVCVLVNQASMSRAVSAAYQLKNEVETAILIGTPAGGGSNWFGIENGNRTLPNSGLAYIIATNASELNGEQPFDALMPDITVYPTLEDYKNGVDTILEAAKSK